MTTSLDRHVKRLVSERIGTDGKFWIVPYITAEFCDLEFKDDEVVGRATITRNDTLCKWTKSSKNMKWSTTTPNMVLYAGSEKSFSDYKTILARRIDSNSGTVVPLETLDDAFKSIEEEVAQHHANLLAAKESYTQA